MDTTILYLTDSVLDPILAEFCRKKLLEVIEDRPLISVSQKPLNFGENICVGEIGRSGISYDKQIEAGAQAIKTRWVAIAEHDCLYSKDHFNFVPEDDVNFWYNMNVWFVQYRNPNHPELDGQYSYWPGRFAHSQLICNADRYYEACKARLEITSDPAWKAKYHTGRVGEPGATDYQKSKVLSMPRDVQHLWGKLEKYVTGFQSRKWNTDTPNLDIRHGDNFSGPRRGKRRTFSLPPWGEFKDVMAN